MYYGWRRYVPVAQRRKQALAQTKALAADGMQIEPVNIEGRKIARSFWGKAWCDHLESFSDFANRLPRGRTYVRNGSVCHLAVETGRIKAMVMGSEMYEVEVEIGKLDKAKWKELRSRCAGKVGSLLELLQGRLSESVMEVVTNREKGLFPRPGQIKMRCSCPDWAVMCKHVAAVLYGVGARLDSKPEMLFVLRGVDHNELVGSATVDAAISGGRRGRRRIAEDDLADVFGVDISAPEIAAAPPRRPTRKASAAKAKTAKKKTGSRKQQAKAAPAKAGKKKARKKTSSARPPAAVTSAMVVAARKRLGLSQAAFAQRVGVSAQTIVNWEGKGGALNLQRRTRTALKRILDAGEA